MNGGSPPPYPMSSCKLTGSSDAFIVSLASAKLMLFELLSNMRPTGGVIEGDPEAGLKWYIQYVSTRPPNVNFGIGPAGAAAAAAGAGAAAAGAGGGAIGGGGAAGVTAGAGAAGGGAASAAGVGAGGRRRVCAKAGSGTTTAIASRHARSRINDPSQIWFP